MFLSLSLSFSEKPSHKSNAEGNPERSQASSVCGVTRVLEQRRGAGRPNTDSVPVECGNKGKRTEVHKGPNPVLAAGTFPKQGGIQASPFSVNVLTCLIAHHVKQQLFLCYLYPLLLDRELASLFTSTHPSPCRGSALHMVGTQAVLQAKSLSFQIILTGSTMVCL